MRSVKKDIHFNSVSGMTQENRRKRDMEIASKAYELIEPLCDSEGVELVHVEYQREVSGKILRLYIDKQGGVTLTDCADISRQAGDILDVCLENDEPYNLEVSSPGFDRPLVKLKDFERFKGLQVKLKIDRPIDGQKNFKGTLLGISENNVNVSMDNRTVSIPFGDIKKAHLVR